MAELKHKYEILLEEAKTQCNKLDRDLKNAMSENIDEILKEKLNVIDQLKKK